MRRRYTIVAEFDDNSPVYTDHQREQIRAMTPAMREGQIASSLWCDVPNLIILEVSELELAELVLVPPTS